MHCRSGVKVVGSTLHTWRILPDVRSHSLKWAWMTECSSRLRSSSS
jgi:hypothetical protein